MRVVWQVLAVVAVSMIGGNADNALDGSPWLTFGLGLLVAVVSVLVYGWVVRRTEHRPSTEVARKGAGSAIGRGTL
ncbi:MAG: CPBP family intramembrane glutamate endopeptidase, partial [Actinomycetes bacterium]